MVPLFSVWLSPPMDNVESDNIIQNLGSLWFFSNSLLSTNPLKPPISSKKLIINNNKQTSNHFKKNKQTSNETIPNIEPPTSKTPSISQINSPNYPSLSNASSLKEIIPYKIVDIDIQDVYIRSLKAKNELGGEGQLQLQLQRSCKPKRRAKKNYLHDKQIFTCNIEGSGVYGYDSVVEMPSCNHKAMKKHLRTWAVAVRGGSSVGSVGSTEVAVAFTAVHNVDYLMMVACS